MVFSRGQLPRVMNLLYNGKQLEIGNDFNYLGVVLTCTGNLKKAKQCQIDKATKALYGMKFQAGKGQQFVYQLPIRSI